MSSGLPLIDWLLPATHFPGSAMRTHAERYIYSIAYGLHK